MAKSKKTSVFVVGSTGRMGRTLLERLEEDSQFQVVGKSSGRNAKELSAIEKLSKESVVIDFSLPVVARVVAKHCAKSECALLECSTGFSDADLTDLQKILRGRTWALTPNTSLGVHVMSEIARFLGESLPAEYQFSLWEAHHSAKKDAPSGTAKLLLNQVGKASGKDRVSPVSSVRGGSEVGHHRLDIHGPFESLSLEHHAQDRKLFAAGALKLAKILSTLEPKAGPYTPSDLWKRLGKNYK